MDYFFWEEPGQLVTRTAEFRVDRIVPTNSADADMAPVYPGITDASSLRDWDPPFPLDLRRVRPIDEEYWEKYSTTPKAFIPLQAGQALWRSRYGALTSIRLLRENFAATKNEFAQQLRERIDPLRAGIAVQNIRSQSLDAARGATNFGEYFVYFSFFLVVSALLLSALFFKLNVERRIREIGLLRGLGMGPSTVQKDLFERRLLAVVRRSRPWVWRRDTVRRGHHRGVAHLVDWRDRHREYHAPSVLPFCSVLAPLAGFSPRFSALP